MEAAELPEFAAGRPFFERDTVAVARRLLGSWFVRWHRGRCHAARIVEVEAYLGEADAAAHSYRGRRTRRVEPMYGPGGLLYVFQVYGMHFCANVVTRREGVPQAVLIRAASHPRLPPEEMSGPGKFCRAFGLTREDSGRDLAGNGRLEIRPSREAARRIVRAPRVGVDYAGEARRWPLRFYLRDEPAVSARR